MHWGLPNLKASFFTGVTAWNHSPGIGYAQGGFQAGKTAKDEAIGIGSPHSRGEGPGVFDAGRTADSGGLIIMRPPE